MARERITRSKTIHVALEVHRQKDVTELEAAGSALDECHAAIKSLSEEVFADHAMARTIRKLCPNPKVLIARGSHPYPLNFKLQWDDGYEERLDGGKSKSSGKILLTGNARKRAVNAYKKLDAASLRKRSARKIVEEWPRRKKDFLKRRLEEHPDLLDRVEDICDIAFRSRPHPMEGDDEPKPGPLPIKGGIDSGKMWESQSIGNKADPKTAAKVLIECFNGEWIHELRKELHLQENLK